MAERHHQDCPIQSETGLDLLPDSSQNHSSFSLLFFLRSEILTWTWTSCETSVHRPPQAQEDTSAVAELKSPGLVCPVGGLLRPALVGDGVVLLHANACW